MLQSKTVVVALSLLLFLSVILHLGAFEDEHRTNIGGLSGVQEFFTSGTFTVPNGVTHVMLTMWGAGGGGGGAFPGYALCVGGGDGGGGAYTNTVVRVTPGVTYNVTVGRGGTGGVNVGDNGTDGGDSQWALGNTILAFAGGGKAGNGGTTGLVYGASGSGGQADSTAQISHSPPAGGTAPYALNLVPSVFTAGNPHPLAAGGPGAYGPSCGGSNGMSGYVLLTF